MNYPSIEIQNLLSENLLESLGQENSRHKFAQPESFSCEINSAKEINKNFSSQIAEAYENLIVRWDLLSSDFPSMNLSDLREKWVKYFFSQFGFDLQYQKSAIEADSGNKFILSYRGWEGANAPIVHSSSFQQDLDDRSKEQTRKYSSHDTLQRFLNQSNSDLWGIVTNGRYLRILRDFSHQSRKAYVQFDLEMLFEGRHYEDFRILYRLIHPSRFIPKEDEKCILENLFEESKSAGVAIGEDLRKNISSAIESLANGFLLATPDLLNRLVDNTENCMQFYQQILRIIYRILFLFYAEQRRLMPTRSTLYAQEYSLSSLRDKVERGETIDEEQFDLWEGLKATFNMVYHGVPELGITSYNGQLFNPDSIHWLINSQCRNDKLLMAIKYMSLFEKKGIPHRISYIELNVDEIGAIYESLLAYIPRISSKMENLGDTNKKNTPNSHNEIPPNTFFLDPRGTSRKTSGSYYTHPGLVNALIESALIPVVETKIEEAGPDKDNQEKALLSLKICDPACGSAAFLISATEYLGDKLAKIRIQDEYPNDTQIRHARRDVLRRCIYGVDLNPMAVELAKVSLWLTAATNDLPLNFLDHRIKCGNSLIGATPELIKKGIPPEAYSPVEGDDKNIARKRMKIAREYYQRKEQERNQLVINVIRKSVEDQTFRVMDLSEKYGENSTQEQKEIEKAYKKSREDYAYKRSKYIADYWTAAFFWKHNDDAKNYPTPMMLDYLLKNVTVQLTGELGNNIKEIVKEFKFFHWHLEFPEVFANGGFDCILGNPPFMGGKKISTFLGEKLRNYLTLVYSPFSNTTDLCAGFFRKAFDVINKDSFFGLIATNSIGQGDTRVASLASIINSGGVITFANRFVKWPGSANVEVNLVTIHKGAWGKDRFLDKFLVSCISSRLDDLIDDEPYDLIQNNKAYIGDFLRGSGFLLSYDEAEKLIGNDPKNMDCLFKYLTGEDLNSHPEQKPSRYVICFHDWPLEKAQRYSELFKLVKEKVKPEREKVNQETHRKNWWLFGAYRKGLRTSIKNLKNVLVRSRVSELHMLMFVPKDIIFSDATVVFAYDDYYHFGILQSSIHEVWLRRNTSTLRTDIRYSPSDCFINFPFPKKTCINVKLKFENIAKQYCLIRENIIKKRIIGLTSLYNLINDQTCKEQDIKEMREAIKKLDNVALQSYGWEDLILKHNFYQNERGQIRFTIERESLREIIKRLILLNHQLNYNQNQN